MSPSPQPNGTESLLVQIASYNTNAQGWLGLPQDLADWLAPTLHVPSFLSKHGRAPDVIAVGFQELLPLHLGLAGRSHSVIDSEFEEHIRSQIEAHAPNKESYSLIAKVANVGIALLVYACDGGIARRVRDVQTQWMGCGPMNMGNKGAVGVRFRVAGDEDAVGEVFTFVCAHLAAHEVNLARRIADYHHIVSCLVFPPLSAEKSSATTIFSTSHLFFLGDLNFRLSIPAPHPLSGIVTRPDFPAAMRDQSFRREMKEFDQLLVERRKSTVFVGLREGEFWKFKCSYKYHLGENDKYSDKRTPSWTDRILYTTHKDSPDTPEESHITNILYTSIPSYTMSDHKPIISFLLLPVSMPSSRSTPPLLKLPPTYTPQLDPRANLKRYAGRVLDRLVGYTWWLFVALGAGSVVVGVFNFFIGFCAWSWWKSPSSGTSV